MVWGVLFLVEDPKDRVPLKGVVVLVRVLLEVIVVRDHVRLQSPERLVVACRHRYRSLLQTRGSGLLDDLDCSWSSGLRKELRYQCGEYPIVGREATGSVLLGIPSNGGY